MYDNKFTHFLTCIVTSCRVQDFPPSQNVLTSGLCSGDPGGHLGGLKDGTRVWAGSGPVCVARTCGYARHSKGGPGPQPALNYGQAAPGCAVRGNRHVPPGATGAQWSPFPIAVVSNWAGRGLSQSSAASLSPAFRGDAAPCQSTGWGMWRLHKPLKHKCSVFILNCKLVALGCPHSRWVMPRISSEINHTECWFFCSGAAGDTKRKRAALSEPGTVQSVEGREGRVS